MILHFVDCPAAGCGVREVCESGQSVSHSHGGRADQVSCHVFRVEGHTGECYVTSTALCHVVMTNTPLLDLFLPHFSTVSYELTF